MFVVGYTGGGAPFGVWEDEIEDSPQAARLRHAVDRRVLGCVGGRVRRWGRS